MHKTLNSVLISLLLVPAVSQAQNLWWGGGTSAWATASNWYTDAGETTPSGAVPTSSNDLFFNTTPDNTSGAAVSVAGNIAANSLTFNTSGTSLLTQSGNRILSLGSGGITVNPGAGTTTIGVSTNSLSVQPVVSQTWTHGAASVFTVRSIRASDTASGPVALTFNVASTGTISIPLSMNDSPDGTKTLSVVVDSAGTGIVSMVSGSFTGGTTVKRGVLTSNGNFGLGNVVVSDTTGAGNARLNLTGVSTNNITVQAGSSGTAALTGSNGSDYQGNILLNRDVWLGSTAGSAQTVIFSGILSGTSNVTIGRVMGGASNPVVDLSGANTYVGKTTIDSATAIVRSLNSVVGGSASSSMGAAPTSVANGTITIGGGATSVLRYVGTGETTDRVLEILNNNGVTLEQAGTGTLKFTSNLVMSGSGNRTLTLRGATAGSGEISGVIPNISGFTTGLTKADSGTWRLSNSSNTYAGATSISGGVLEVVKLSNGGTASSIGAASTTSTNLTFNGGTLRYIGTGDATNKSFQINSGGATFDSSGSGAISFTNTAAATHTSTTSPRVLTLAGTNTGANTMAAVITNASGSAATSVVKDGAGTWTLSSTSTYTGATTINAGTLLINGSLNAGSAVALNAGTLGGAGTVNGLVTTAGLSSRLSPGNSPGTLILNGGLDATAGATFVFELGTSSDLLAMGSGVLTGSSFANGLVFNFSDAAGFAAGTPYTLMTFGSAVGLDYSDLMANILPAGYVLDSGFGTGGFAINGTNLQVQFMVPEPSTAVLLAAGLGLTLLRRRRI